ncbi:MAG: hypothetical protein KJZ83_15065 [Burkholderiaceae bacterium]|nr:hypothetical protein [Burkholderiaceae bacterium]
MSMTSRERLMAALNHKQPDRVPIDLGGYPGATSMNVLAYDKLKKYLRLAVDKELRLANVWMFTAEFDKEILDKFGVDTCCATPTISLNDFGTPQQFQDVWKVNWAFSESDTYAPLDGPFFKENGTLTALRAFDWYTPGELSNAQEWREKATELRQSSDRALIAKLPLGIVTLTQLLRGFDDWLADLYTNREFFDELMDRCAETWIRSATAMIDAVGDQIDVFVWGDDYGFQNGPMISPEMFSEVVTPRYKRMLRTIKEKTNAKILLHSCGSVHAYLDEFIDMGIDALNPIQVSAKDMDPARIKDKYGDRIALWGAVGIDDLISDTPSNVKKLVRRRISELGKDGGYVLSATHNLLGDVPLANVVAMFEAAAES